MTSEPPRPELPRDPAAIERWHVEANPGHYRQLALYLQVLREVLPASVDQAVFQLATQIHPARYAALPAERRALLHQRLAELVQRFASLLTVEQVSGLAARLDRQRRQRRRQRQHQLLQRLIGSSAALSRGSDAGPPSDGQVPRPESPQGFPAPGGTYDTLSAASPPGGLPLPPGSVSLGLEVPLMEEGFGRLPEPGLPMPWAFDDDGGEPEDADDDRHHDALGPGDDGPHDDDLEALDLGADASDDSPGSRRAGDELIAWPWSGFDAADDHTDQPDPGGAQPSESDPERQDDDASVLDLEGRPSFDPEAFLSGGLQGAARQLADALVADGEDGDEGRRGDDETSHGPWAASGSGGGLLPRDPVLLEVWLQGYEQALSRRLRSLSHAINAELMRCGLLSILLPSSLLDAVLAGRVDTLGAAPNLLRLQLPMALPGGGQPLQPTVLLLRCADLELEQPRLRKVRRALQQRRLEGRRMAQHHRRLQRRLQAREAEALWLQDIRSRHQSHRPSADQS